MSFERVVAVLEAAWSFRGCRQRSALSNGAGETGGDSHRPASRRAVLELGGLTDAAVVRLLDAAQEFP
jgi:hypothetical protein